MTSRQAWFRRLLRPWSRALAKIDPRAIYVGLAIALAAWVVFDHLSGRQQHRAASSYDWMMTHRFHAPHPDPAIVLLDIDERSLAALEPEYGRWPWPRDVLATVLSELEKQGARAVVFDILFADADRQNPVSEHAFADAISRDRIAYFAVLRLSPSSDASSVVHAGDLPGLVVVRRSGAAPPLTGSGPAVAVSLPYIDSIVKSRRLGTENVDPDRDGMIRRYRLYEDIGDFRVLALPARLALDFGWPMPNRAAKLLRFNTTVPAYRAVSFSDFFVDSLKSQRNRDPNEFRDKIVVVGASAQGLFDIKGTPIARTHPGMDLLATAIDDTKNDRFIDELGPSTDIAISLALLCLMTWLCIRYSHEQLRLAFIVAPGILFAISYLTLNLGRVFVDLTSPASIAFVYFSIVKLYSAQVRKRWSEGELFAPLLAAHVDHWVGCLATSLHPTRRAAGFETRFLNDLRTHAPDVRITSGVDAQNWLGSAFSGVLVATWVERADAPAAIARDREQARLLFAALRSHAAKGIEATMHFEEVMVPAEPTDPGDRRARDSVPFRLRRLRALVALTVLRMTGGAGASGS